MVPNSVLSRANGPAGERMTARVISRTWLGRGAALALACAASFPVHADAIGAVEAARTAAVRDYPRVIARSDPQLTGAYGNLALNFEANQGQADQGVRFVARIRGYSVLLTDTEATLVAHRRSGTRASPARTGSSMGLDEPERTGAVASRVRMKLIGANPQPRISGAGKLPGKSHYFIGNNPRNWLTDVGHYAKVLYQAVYPGVDLAYYGNHGQLEYDFIVAPGADPAVIALAFPGANTVQIDAEGDLVLFTATGQLRFKKPMAYQEVGGSRHEVAAQYVIAEAGTVSFRVGPYDSAETLVIDPVLAYSTYLGGNETDEGFGIAVDAAGNTYVTGRTGSANFPKTDTSSPAFAGCNGTSPCGIAFVTKLNAAGQLVYSTYFGGSFDAIGATSIAVDAAGSAYIAGTTASMDFPTTPGAYKTTCTTSPYGTCQAAFVTKLDAAGSALAYSTYLFGNFNTELGTAPFDEGLAIAVDAAGNAHVTGSTGSTTFPTTPGAFQTVFGGARDAFVTKLNASGSDLVYSTYLGGIGLDAGFAIAVDAAGNAYVAGETNQPSTVNPNNFPTVNAFQPAQGGMRDGFVAKLSAAGQMIYSTYVGGGNTDVVLGIAADGSGSAYLTGQTKSTDFPTANPIQGPNTLTDTTGDAFVTKLDASGALAYSTFLGGLGFDYGTRIAVDALGNAHVTGVTSSADFPTTALAFQTLAGGYDDAFVTKLNPAGNALLYSSYVGGSGNDQGNAIAVGGSGWVAVAGVTNSSNFPTANAFQATNGGGYDAFALRLDPSVLIAALAVAKGGTGSGTVTSAPAGINCGVVCAHEFDLGTAVTLTAAADATSVFAGWSGACSGTGDCTLTLDAPKSVTATFAAAADTQAPSVPLGLTAYAAGNSQINLAWNASTDVFGVTQYRIYRDGVLVTTLTGTPPATAYSDLGLAVSTPHSYAVAACDAASNCSAQSTVASATTLAVNSSVLIGEYPIAPLTTVSGVDSGVAAAPDGSVWFTGSAGDMLGRISASGTVTAFAIPAGGQLTGGIAAGPDGSAWATKEFSGRIVRITPGGAVTEFPVSIDSPRRISAGPDGNMWFTGANLVGRITPAGAISYFPLPNANSFPVGITAGPDGNLWFVEIGANKIGRITPSGVITEYPVLTPVAPGTSQLFSITAGPDGNLWFTEANRIGRITPAGAVTEFVNPSAGSYAIGIATGPDGNLWFTSNNNSTIGRITPAGLFLADLATPSPIGAPQHITTGPDGLIWFTEGNTNKIGVISLANIASHFPLTAGATWSYTVNSGAASVTRTVVPGTTDINGVNATLLSDSGAGGRYLTNDANGIREHREIDSTGDVVTFSPPITYASALRIIIGSPLFSSGTASGTVSGTPFSLPYSHSALMQAIETVTVPAGTFRAARAQFSLNLPGVISTETDWFASGVGLVKGIADTDTYELTSSNLAVTTPDVFSYTVPSAAPPFTQNTFTVTGITAAAPISIAGGEYSVSGGAYTSVPGSVTNGQSVTVRPNALVNPLVKQAVVTIGGVSGVFNALVPAVPSVMLSTASLDFGSQTVGTTSAARIVTLTNSGNGVLGISAIAVSGDYGRTTICGATLEPQTSCTISLSFAPTVAGARAGLLSIASDAAGSPHTVSLSGTGAVPDTQAPSVPQGLSASALGPDRIELSWTASTDNVGVSGYAVYRDGGTTPIAAVSGTRYVDTRLAASTAYSYTVSACDAAGNCSSQSAAASATTQAATGGTAFTPQIFAKWNLLGNTGTVALDVTALFGTQDAPVVGVSPYVLSVWKWVVNPSTGAGRWAFFTPSLTKAGSDAAAAAQGYDALSAINPGEGFWVNRTNPPGLTVPVTLSGPVSAPFYYDATNFGLLKKNAWHLIATDSPAEPSVFNSSDVNPTPPNPGVVPTGNFQTLWAWSAAAQKWYFYSSAIEAAGYTSAMGTAYTGLDAVRQAAVDSGYLDFHTATPSPMTLGSGMGFWVRR